MSTPLSFLYTVVRALLMSMVAAITLATSVAAHETAPAVASVSVGSDTVDITLIANAEALLAGIDTAEYADTNDAPQAAEYDRLRALEPAELAAAFEAAWPELRSAFVLTNAGDLTLDSVEVAVVENLELSRESRLVMSAPVDAGAEGVTFGLAEGRGNLIVRQTVGDEVFAEFLDAGQMSELLPVQGVVQETAGEAFVRFVIEGFEHIIPKGLDHILFVLGLFFFALAWSPILWQVTAFTVAHTVTLALATLGVVNIPDDWMWLVEALIALSITYVAIENILQPKLGWWRPAVVFGFGLLHGLGFASVLGDLGLAQGQFVVSLIAFNIGVEIGQLAVILAAFVLILLGVQAARMARLEDPEEQMVRDLPEMYRANAIVGSIIIGIIGAYWFIERAFF
ncbi:MAG: HupE/UreJ family protein [Pseudomonadota bacterium]